MYQSDNVHVMAWPFKMEQLDRPETSVTYYLFTLHNILDEQSSDCKRDLG